MAITTKQEYINGCYTRYGTRPLTAMEIKTETRLYNGRKTPSFSYGDISPLSVKSSMDIDRKKFTLSIELDKHIQYNLNHEI